MAQNPPRKLIDWTSEHVVGFGQRPLVAGHRLHQLSLFSDKELIEVLENHPRDQLQAFTMGTDASLIHEWRPVDIAGLSGKHMLAAIEGGRFWFHLFRMQNAYGRYRDLLA